MDTRDCQLCVKWRHIWSVNWFTLSENSSMIQTPKQHFLFITLHVLDIDCFPCVRAHWIKPKSDSLWRQNQLVMCCSSVLESCILSPMGPSDLNLTVTSPALRELDGYIRYIRRWKNFTSLYSIMQLNVCWKPGGLHLTSVGFVHFNVISGGWRIPQSGIVLDTNIDFCWWHCFAVACPALYVQISFTNGRALNSWNQKKKSFGCFSLKHTAYYTIL